MKFLGCFVLKSIEKNSIDRVSTLTDNQIIHMFFLDTSIFRLHQTNIDSMFGVNKTIYQLKIAKWPTFYFNSGKRGDQFSMLKFDPRYKDVLYLS